MCVCVQWAPGAGAAWADGVGSGDREADGPAEGMADARAAEAPTAAPHTREREATNAPARGNNALPRPLRSQGDTLGITLHRCYEFLNICSHAEFIVSWPLRNFVALCGWQAIVCCGVCVFSGLPEVKGDGPWMPSSSAEEAQGDVREVSATISPSSPE